MLPFIVTLLRSRGPRSSPLRYVPHAFLRFAGHRIPRATRFTTSLFAFATIYDDLPTHHLPSLPTVDCYRYVYTDCCLVFVVHAALPLHVTCVYYPLDLPFTFWVAVPGFVTVVISPGIPSAGRLDFGDLPTAQVYLTSPAAYPTLHTLHTVVVHPRLPRMISHVVVTAPPLDLCVGILLTVGGRLLRSHPLRLFTRLHTFTYRDFYTLPALHRRYHSRF